MLYEIVNRVIINTANHIINGFKCSRKKTIFTKKISFYIINIYKFLYTLFKYKNNSKIKMVKQPRYISLLIKGILYFQ